LTAPLAHDRDDEEAEQEQGEKGDGGDREPDHRIPG